MGPGSPSLDDVLAQHRQLDHIVAMSDAALQNWIFELELEPAGGADAAYGRKSAAEHRAAVGEPRASRRLTAMRVR